MNLLKLNPKKLKVEILLVTSFSLYAIAAFFLPADPLLLPTISLGAVAGAIAGCLGDNFVLRIFTLLLILGGIILGAGGCLPITLAGQELIRTFNVPRFYTWLILIAVSFAGAGLGWLIRVISS